MKYWYWTLRDGAILVEVKPSLQPAAPKGYFPLWAVNDI